MQLCERELAAASRKVAKADAKVASTEAGVEAAMAAKRRNTKVLQQVCSNLKEQTPQKHERRAFLVAAKRALEKRDAADASVVAACATHSEAQAAQADALDEHIVASSRAALACKPMQQRRRRSCLLLQILPCHHKPHRLHLPSRSAKSVRLGTCGLCCNGIWRMTSRGQK